MAKKVNPAIIGAFVLAAIGLLISSILMFSGGTLFKHRNRFVMFFEDNVAGLSVGAPVKFRGVEIGSVRSISLVADKESHKVDIPIVVEVDPEKFKTRGKDKADLGEAYQQLIELGLRARLDIQSFVTGQYYIQLDFLPDTPVRLTGVESDYKEIPTIKSQFTKLGETFRDLPLQEIVGNIEDITEMVKEGLEEESLKNLAENLGEVLDNLNKLLLDADDMVLGFSEQSQNIGGEMTEALSRVVENVDAVTARTNSLLDALNREVGPISSEIHGVLTSFERTLNDASETLATAEQLMGNSEIRFKLGKALDEMRAAAKSVRELGDYLERNPEALIRGKQAAQ